MFVLIFQVYAGVCDGDERIVCFVEFVISSEHSPELFDIAEVTLHYIPPFVQFLIIFPRLLAITLRRNHRTHAALLRLRTTSISLIRLVHQQRCSCTNRFRNLCHQFLTYRIVCIRTRRQLTNNRSLLIGNDAVDFGRQTTTTLADRLLALFLGAPVPSG